MGVDNENIKAVYDKLTPKQRAFVKEYIIDFNGAQAAIRAGYSEKTAKEQAAQNLTKLNVQKAIEVEKKARDRRVEISQDQIIEELALIAFSDIGDYSDIKRGRVKIKDMTNMPADKRRVISEISTGKAGTKVKLWDKMNALSLLGKHKGMWKDTPDVTVVNNVGAEKIDDAIEKWKKEKKEQ